MVPASASGIEVNRIQFELGEYSSLSFRPPQVQIRLKATVSSAIP